MKYKRCSTHDILPLLQSLAHRVSVMGRIKPEVISMNVKHGDRLIDWQEGRTFYPVRQGTQDGRNILDEDDSSLHRLDNCQAPNE